MTDDVKQALEWLRVLDMQWEHAHAGTLLDHIDGEPARQVAAAAAAREEQRETLGLGRWPALVPFVAAMVRKLDANKEEKGGREGWIDDDPRRLLKRVVEEAEELSTEVLGFRPVGSPFSDRVLDEAADVANMAMMVADAAGLLEATPLTATPLADEIAALRAQNEAARTYARQALDYGEDCDATDLLRAMDEAKP